MAAPRKTKPADQATTESLRQRPTKANGPSKMDRAIKIMEEKWDDLQAGKVKRKDVIERFMDEADLTKAGSPTYHGNIKKKLAKTG